MMETPGRGLFNRQSPLSRGVRQAALAASLLALQFADARAENVVDLPVLGVTVPLPGTPEQWDIRAATYGETPSVMLVFDERVILNVAYVVDSEHAKCGFFEAGSGGFAEEPNGARLFPLAFDASTFRHKSSPDMEHSLGCADAGRGVLIALVGLPPGPFDGGMADVAAVAQESLDQIVAAVRAKGASSVELRLPLTRFTTVKLPAGFRWIHEQNTLGAMFGTEDPTRVDMISLRSATSSVRRAVVAIQYIEGEEVPCEDRLAENGALTTERLRAGWLSGFHDVDRGTFRFDLECRTHYGAQPRLLLLAVARAPDLTYGQSAAVKVLVAEVEKATRMTYVKDPDAIIRMYGAAGAVRPFGGGGTPAGLGRVGLDLAAGEAPWNKLSGPGYGGGLSFGADAKGRLAFDLRAGYGRHFHSGPLDAIAMLVGGANRTGPVDDAETLPAGFYGGVEVAGILNYGRYSLNFDALGTQREFRGNFGVGVTKGDKTWVAGLEASAYAGAVVPSLYFGLGGGRPNR